MSPSIVRRPKAKRDIVEIALYLSEHNGKPPDIPQGALRRRANVARARL